jgi:uncharacterized protein YdiU (UPF0061 family)
MAEQGADFTNSYRALCDAAEGSDAGFQMELGDSQAAAEWLGRWRTRLGQEETDPHLRAAEMRRSSPAVIPRNHRADAALQAAIGGDLGPLDDLVRVLASPWKELPDGLPYRCPPEPHEIDHQTFCGI